MKNIGQSNYHILVKFKAAYAKNGLYQNLHTNPGEKNNIDKLIGRTVCSPGFKGRYEYCLLRSSSKEVLRVWNNSGIEVPLAEWHKKRQYAYYILVSYKKGYEIEGKQFKSYRTTDSELEYLVNQVVFGQIGKFEYCKLISYDQNKNLIKAWDVNGKEYSPHDWEKQSNNLIKTKKPYILMKFKAAYALNNSYKRFYIDTDGSSIQQLINHTVVDKKGKYCYCILKDQSNKVLMIWDENSNKVSMEDWQKRSKASKYKAYIIFNRGYGQIRYENGLQRNISFPLTGEKTTAEAIIAMKDYLENWKLRSQVMLIKVYKHPDNKEVAIIKNGMVVEVDAPFQILREIKDIEIAKTM